MRDVVPAVASAQPVVGAAPPEVFTRCTLETLLSTPSGPSDFAARSSHGMAPASVASA